MRLKAWDVPHALLYVYKRWGEGCIPLWMLMPPAPAPSSRREEQGPRAGFQAQGHRKEAPGAPTLVPMGWGP